MAAQIISPPACVLPGVLSCLWLKETRAMEGVGDSPIPCFGVVRYGTYHLLVWGWEVTELLNHDVSCNLIAASFPLQATQLGRESMNVS